MVDHEVENPHYETRNLWPLSERPEPTLPSLKIWISATTDRVPIGPLP